MMQQYGELPPNLQGRVDAWLEVNKIEPHLVRYGVFPLGMVARWIERAESAEAKLKEMQAALAHHEGKRAPVQGYAAGLPWDMHLQAYDGYCKEYGAQKALIDLEGRNCRGGFGIYELDSFLPGWREELRRRADLARAAAAS